LRWCKCAVLRHCRVEHKKNRYQPKGFHVAKVAIYISLKNMLVQYFGKFTF
jgi:hypothetical protein